jgi:hypothetical protein
MTFVVCKSLHSFAATDRHSDTYSEQYITAALAVRQQILTLNQKKIYLSASAAVSTEATLAYWTVTQCYIWS